MNARVALLSVSITWAVASAGCHKPAGSGTAAPAAAPAATSDFRTLNKGAIEIIIADKTGSPVTLTPAGPNKYTGTRQVPGDTLRVPVTVTVEEKRIVIESSAGGLTQRQVITPRGLEKDDLR